MYLYKNHHSNYYTRTCFPADLRSRSFPSEIRISLKTKCRDVAVDRNLVVAHFMRKTIKGIESNTRAKPFIAKLKKKLDEIARAGFNFDNPAAQPTVTMQNPPLLPEVKSNEDFSLLLTKFRLD